MSDNSGDIVNKIVEANALESAGDVEAAVALYQEIWEQDPGGNYGDVAQQALYNLESNSPKPSKSTQPQQISTNQSDLKTAGDDDDLVNKIVEANALESVGDVEAATALYQEIWEQDPGGNYGDVAQQALDNLQQRAIKTVIENKQVKSGSWWSRLSIKAKTSFILTGVALTSSIGISTVAYILADKTINQNINTIQLSQSQTLAKEIALFMRDRRSDIQALSGLGVFADPQLRANSTLEQKQNILKRYLEAYGVYNSIAIFDLQGDLVVNSSGKPASNHKNHIYFQEALKTKQPFIGQPRLSKSSGIYAVYTAAPIKDTQTGEIIGVIRARMPVANLQDIITVGEASKAYLLDAQGQVFLASNEQEQQQLLALESNQTALSSFFDFYQELQQELNRRQQNKVSIKSRQKKAIEQKSVFSGQEETAYLTTFNQIDTDFFRETPDLGWSTVIAIDNDLAFAAQKQLLQVFILGTVVAGLIVAALSRLIAQRATQPIIEAAAAVKQMGQGNLGVKLKVSGEDELADLNSNINKMAGHIKDLLFTQEEETKQQRREKEQLQQGVMGLLLDVEGAQKGDLTVKAQMTDGVVGSIADAFNATMNKLRGLLQQVQVVSSEVGQLSLKGEDSVRQLSESALKQTQEIDQALSSIDEINYSVEIVANYAQEAATIARHGSIQAKEGDLAMDATVNSIEKIRDTVANTSKKVKQLAESSQEIAQIVEIISGISEKTNLLAFNASVEAARAGEHGEGFRIVAEEVRRLADRITEATKDIQQLVSTIQQDTTTVLQGIETSTSEVVNGTELVRMTKTNLRSLAETSKQIDEYLNYISTSTTDQTNTSRLVNQKISGIATVAKTNSSEAQQVVQSLKTLVSEAENLQSSVSQFKLEA
ncbi:MAG: methyl-accepting chemotaxis protein [Cyanobacteria bacterium P01_A01_bin.83]